MLNLIKTIITAISLSSVASDASAYTIGGAYANLVSCVWGQMGYEYGYIGTYDVNGKLYEVFFGSGYCKY